MTIAKETNPEVTLTPRPQAEDEVIAAKPSSLETFLIALKENIISNLTEPFTN